MAGNSKGVKNSWETRRALYGPSGRRPKSEPSAKKSNESKKAAPSRYMNKEKRDVRVMNGVRLPPDHQLELLAYRREELVKAINFFNRYKKTKAWAELPGYVRESYQRAHNEHTREMRTINRDIEARKKALLAQARKRHGER